MFPKVIILEGDGNLFWAKGMRSSWEMALKQNYDMYFLMNDDVELYERVFDQIRSTHEHCLATYNKSGIYIGATEDKNQEVMTYSGSVVLNSFLYTQKRLAPNGKFQLCDLANANIMIVPNAVVEKIEILSGEYSHGIADYDYTLRATKKKIPVLVTPQYCGQCEYDHKDAYDGFSEKTLKKRRGNIYSPKGLAYNSYSRYKRKFFSL